MSNIVIIVGSYYPNYSAVGKCMGNIADVLSKDNNVTVICEQNLINQERTEIHNNQKIIRVFPKKQRSYLIAKEKQKSNKGVIRAYYTLNSKVQRVERVTKRLFSKTSINSEIVSAYLEALLTLDTKPDLVIPTCIPFESVVAALNYKKKYPNTVIIPVLFDLFAGNTNLNYFDFNKKIKWKANLLLEEQMLEQSKAVFFVENWKDHLNKYFHQHNGKVIQIEHPLLIKPSNIDSDTDNHDNIVHIVYTGVIDIKNRNPEPVLQILDKLSSKKIVFDFYGYGSAESIVRDFTQNHSQFIFHGKVDTKTAERVRQRADVLLSIGNSDYSQIPSKLIEYIASGKLIIHFSIDDNDPAIKLLEQYHNKIIVSMSHEVEIDKLEKQIFEMYKTKMLYSDIEQIYHQANPEYIAEQLKIRGGQTDLRRSFKE